jgi:hypothetical protein
MESTKRPGLYTFLGVLSVLALIGAVMSVLGLAGLVALLGDAAPMGMIVVLGILTVVLGLFYLAEVVGFFKMKKYMPKLVMAGFALAVLSVILNYVMSAETFAWGNQIIGLIVNGAIVWKVNQDKALFKN